MGGDVYPCLSTVSITDVDTPGSSARHTFYIVWVKAIPLVSLAFSTVTFNLMVLWMFKVKRSLRSCKNIYLASLALADLIIGMCMFFAIVQQLRGHMEWLPTLWCRVYLVLRQSALYVSLLSLVLITGDRWWSVHYPFSYRARRRTRNAFIAVVFVWLFGFALHIPPIALWDIMVTRNMDDIKNSSTTRSSPSWVSAKSCELPFSDSILFVAIASVVQYFIPLVAMLCLNCSLYIGILQRKRIQIRRSVNSTDKLYLDRRTSVSSIPDLNSAAEENLQLLNGFGVRHTTLQTRTLRRNSADMVLLRSSVSSPFVGSPKSPASNSMRRFSWAPRKCSISTTKDGEELAKSLLIRQDRKAALWLALLVIVFLICWLPYSIVGILQSAWYSSVPSWVKDVTFWFLLANSAINPLLYGLFNKEMRRAIKQWLCGSPSSRQWRAKQALLFYGANFNTAVTAPRRIASFDAVPE